METIKSEKKLCLICMEEHEVDTVKMVNTEVFKNVEVSFHSIFDYCSNAMEYFETEEMIRANSLAMKDAYRKTMGLLTSNDIVMIREKYGVSQKDFSEILDWGRATITRYENHQVQDRAHDDIIRKIDSAPKWFLEMLNRSKDRISYKAYIKYKHKANEQFNKKSNQYMINHIQAIYADIEDYKFTGGVELNLAKVVEMINYLTTYLDCLNKVALMKMLWFSDYLHYKKNGVSISGLAYNFLPKGAVVPKGYDHIVLLDGVNFETVWHGANITHKFIPNPNFQIKELTRSEIQTLNDVIHKLGNYNTDEIVDMIHEESAYKCTEGNCLIPFTFAEELTID